MSAPPPSNITPTFYFWLLDVRPLWQGKAITDAAPDALALLAPAEVTRARAFYFLRDAKLNVASSLLKRAFAARALGIPWREATFSRRGNAVHGKPAIDVSAGRDGNGPGTGVGTGTETTTAVSSSEGAGAGDVPVNPDARHRVDFNISHQAGLVALVGCVCAPAVPASGNTATAIATAGTVTESHIPPILVGVDITSPTERQAADARTIAAEGFGAFVDMHAEVFSAADVARMKASETTGTGENRLQMQLRRFYAYWALKEAYVKMSGEALLADWLGEVEFVDVRVPGLDHGPGSETFSTGGASTVAGAGGEDGLVPGERVTGIGAVFKGTRVPDVHMSLQAFGDGYLVATAVKGSEGEADVECEYTMLDLERDVYAWAR